MSYTGRGGTQCSGLYRERKVLSVVGYTGRGGTRCSGLYRERGYSVY